jgi:hypothetical protein
MSDPLDLLRIEGDEPLPPDHERAIRAGLAHLLGPLPMSRPPRADVPVPPQPAPEAAASASSSAGLAAKVGPYVLIALVSGGVGVGIGRITAPPSPPSSLSAPLQSSAAAPALAPSAPSLALAPSLQSPQPAVGPEASHAQSLNSASTGAPAVTVAPSASGAAPSFAPSPANVDAAEQSLLERARAALVRHDAQAAGQALDLYDQQFRRPRHAEERDYLRIQWARERGDQADVARRAKAFLGAYPESMLRPRVEKLLAPP